MNKKRFKGKNGRARRKGKTRRKRKKVNGWENK